LTDEIPDIFEMLKDITFPENPVFDRYNNAAASFFSWRDMLKNPNGWIYYQCGNFVDTYDPDKSDYHKGFSNMLKILSYWFETSPYYNSRMGWWLWYITSYVKQDSYYPLMYCKHYDPRFWYLKGELPRPDEGMTPEDIFAFESKPQAKGKEVYRMRI